MTGLAQLGPAGLPPLRPVSGRNPGGSQWAVKCDAVLPERRVFPGWQGARFLDRATASRQVQGDPGGALQAQPAAIQCAALFEHHHMPGYPGADPVRLPAGLGLAQCGQRAPGANQCGLRPVRTGRLLLCADGSRDGGDQGQRDLDNLFFQDDTPNSGQCCDTRCRGHN